MPKSIMDLAQSILKNPLTVQVTPVSSTVETVSQSLYHVGKDQKKDLLFHLLQEKDIKRAIVFTKTKH
jgi:ATP-dependent RNA helicase RhlE